ncbi:MAG: trypsin-like peptidase domain-containing protein [Limisphaerales bacterium]
MKRRACHWHGISVAICLVLPVFVPLLGVSAQLPKTNAATLHLPSPELPGPGVLTPPDQTNTAKLVPTNAAVEFQGKYILLTELQRLAEKGDAEAQAHLGWAYHSGNGVQQDYAEGVKWYRKAADQGNSYAQLNMGFAYALGRGVEMDLKQAGAWYQKAADQGDVMAIGFLWNIGWNFASGDGVEKDLAEAVKWYRKAAEKGDVQAQYCLGYAYEHGEGVAKDASEAAKWYRKAADQGDATSQSSLANLYLNGEGVPVDYGEALKWFRPAAEQSSGTAIIKGFAQLKLGLMYDRGNGVPADFIEAYKWYNLAAANGYTNAASSRGFLARDMTPEQIAEAQRRSSVFVARNAASGSSAQAGATAIGDTPKASGSGFFITPDGYFLTCFHVVEGASRVVVVTGKGRWPATVIKTDPANDIAVLKVAGPSLALPLAASRGVKLGDAVFTIGFPNLELQGAEPKFTDGKISSLAGAEDDPRQFQISVAVQPGNSGGPLVNQYGNVVGIVTAKLSDIATLKATGSLPQNVNYAIKSAYASILLDSVPGVVGKLKEPNPPRDRKFEEVVKEVQAATGLVLVF